MLTRIYSYRKTNRTEQCKRTNITKCAHIRFYAQRGTGQKSQRTKITKCAHISFYAQRGTGQKSQKTKITNCADVCFYTERGKGQKSQHRSEIRRKRKKGQEETIYQNSRLLPLQGMKNTRPCLPL